MPVKVDNNVIMQSCQIILWSEERANPCPQMHHLRLSMKFLQFANFNNCCHLDGVKERHRLFIVRTDTM